MSTLEHVEDNLQLASVEPLELERFMQLFRQLELLPQIRRYAG